MTRKTRKTWLALACLLLLAPILTAGLFPGGSIPTHDHTSAAQGGALGASAANTTALKTATGSATFDCSVNSDVNGNDYSFFPMVVCPNSFNSFQFRNAADPGNTIPLWRFQNNVAGTGTVRWRYITASDTPYWWVCLKAGVVVATWTSDDPPTKTFTSSPYTAVDALGNPDPTVSCTQIQAADIQAMNLPASSYAKADAWIAQHGYSAAKRDFRALQQHAGDLAPSSWLRTNVTVSAGKAALVGALPAPAAAVLQ